MATSHSSGWSSSWSSGNSIKKQNKGSKPKSLLTLSRRALLSSTTASTSSSSSKAATTSDATLPSRLSRRVVRSHHVLQKQRSQALACNDIDAAAIAEAEIERLGGIETYQRASISGQSKGRGGDSSKVLVDWFQEAGLQPQMKPGRRKVIENEDEICEKKDQEWSLSLLEVGCLSPFNALAPYFGERTMIDLNSQHPSIRQIDFIHLELPSNATESTPSGTGNVDADANAIAGSRKRKRESTNKINRRNEGKEEGKGNDRGHNNGNGYDLISLSLVLNYVPTPAERGEMLKRTTLFFRSQRGQERQEAVNNKASSCTSASESLFPSLFLVLPASCVMNSRYLTEALLTEIMGSLGYSLLRRKISPKLAYYLWRYSDSDDARLKGIRFRKKEVNPGSGRNNFAIVL